MKKSSLKSRTDEQLIAEITALLDEKSATRRSIQDSVHIGSDASKRLLTRMHENNAIETYRGKSGSHTWDLYCLYGRRPQPVAGSRGIYWARTLAGFRDAISAALAVGNDPFKAKLQ
ncbi:hypothetical protein PQR39_35360 [Paraburkholderia sediminicola]|uniref:hypothetical protein n=1 Tax=Paraburkholderia sediminicola TaxID=458836 RepID=UPI0038B94508